MPKTKIFEMTPKPGEINLSIHSFNSLPKTVFYFVSTIINEAAKKRFKEEREGIGTYKGKYEKVANATSPPKYPTRV